MGILDMNHSSCCGIVPTDDCFICSALNNDPIARLENKGSPCLSRSFFTRRLNA